MLWRERPLDLSLACVASVSARVRRERWDESTKKGMTREGEEEGNLVSSSPLPLPLPPFFFFLDPALTFAQ